MGKIILNNIEYGTGTPNSSNVDTTNLVKKDNIVTVIDENVTDEQIPSAKAVHTAIQNVSVSVPVNTYTKEEVNNLLNTKADSSAIVDSYTKTEVDGLLADKVNTDDLVDAYSKTEVDGLLADKADSTDIVDAYTKGEVDGFLADKANVDDIVDAYTKTETDDLLTAKADTTALDSKVNKTAIVTSVSSTSTDEEIPSAKSVYTALQNVSGGATTDVYNKEEVDNLLDTKADTTALNNYVTNSDLTSTLSNYADITGVSEALTNFSTYVDNTYATKTSVATNTDNIASIITRIQFFQNPNLLINCSFQVNDYNVTSVPSNNTSVVYLVNRWATTSKGLSCSVPAANILRLLASSGCTGLSVFQILENRDAVTNAAALTFSFWARAVGTKSIGKRVIGRIGSGGGNTGEAEIRLTNDWQFVSSTREMPYFGSKSDGGVFISAPDITTEGSGFEITNVKLEFGYDVSPYIPRLYSEDLALCQRYYQKWDGISHTDVPLGNFSVGTGDICTILHLPTTMRTTPSIKSTLTDVELYGCNSARTAYEAHEPTHLSVYSMSNNTVTLRCRSNGTFAVGSAGIFRIKFGQQYKFILDAELYE